MLNKICCFSRYRKWDHFHTSHLIVSFRAGCQSPIRKLLNNLKSIFVFVCQLSISSVFCSTSWSYHQRRLANLSGTSKMLFIPSSRSCSKPFPSITLPLTQCRGSYLGVQIMEAARWTNKDIGVVIFATIYGSTSLVIATCLIWRHNSNRSRFVFAAKWTKLKYVVPPILFS